MKNTGINFDCSDPCVNKKILEALSKGMNIKLPNSYSKFLLETNGGIPNKRYFFFYAQDDGSELQVLYGLTSQENLNLIKEVLDFQHRIPKNMIPVGNDTLGNLVLMSINGPDYGKIYFWDHEGEEEEPSYNNLKLVSNSFEEFLYGLKSSEEVFG